MIYTTYMGNLKNINKNFKKYSIMAYTPEWCGGYIDGTMEELAPSKDTLIKYKNKEIDRWAYEKEYRAKLDQLNIKKIAKRIDGCVLMCTCKVGNMCHRHILADVMRENDVKVAELNVKSNLKSIKVELESVYTVKKCENNPGKIYAYPDSIGGGGKSGLQVVRGLSNTVGIPIVAKPVKKASRYLKESDSSIVMERLDILRRYAYNGYTIVFPKAGLGITLDNMGTHSPILHIKLHTYIEDNFMCYIKG